MFEPKKNSVKRDNAIKQVPVKPDVGNWTGGGDKNDLNVKKPGFER
jgi:hypothetical protein